MADGEGFTDAPDDPGVARASRGAGSLACSAPAGGRVMLRAMSEPERVIREPEVVTGPRQIEAEAPYASVLESMVEGTSAPHGGRVALPSGRVVEVRADGGGEGVTVRSATGEVELEVV